MWSRALILHRRLQRQVSGRACLTPVTPDSHTVPRDRLKVALCSQTSSPIMLLADVPKARTLCNKCRAPPPASPS